MDKTYTTSEFNLSEEIIIEDGKKIGMRYTLEVRAASSELKNLYLLNLIKNQYYRFSDKKKSNYLPRPILLLMIGYLLLLIIAIIPSMMVTIDPNTIINRSIMLSFEIIRIILAGYLVWFGLFFKSSN